MIKCQHLKIILILTLVISVIAWLIIFKTSKHQQENTVSNEEKLLNIADVIPVSFESINDVVYFTGDLSPKTQTIVSSEIDAKVTKVLVDEGQEVKVGQVLAELDTLDLAQAVMQQEAQVAGARAKYELDLQKMQKQEELYKQGFVSKIAYEELIANYKESLQNYKSQAALLIRNKKQLGNARITAPFTGIVYQKSIQPGQLALKNTKLFSMANLDDMEIKAAIPSEYINRVKIGQQVLFTLENDSRVFHGTVARINQVAQSGTRSYLVYVNFPNRQYHLKAGQFIKGSIILRSLGEQLVIPCDAIRHNESAAFVLVWENAPNNPDGQVEAKNINEILRNSMLNRCAVTGLNKDETVIAGNVLSVKAGDKAQILH